MCGTLENDTPNDVIEQQLLQATGRTVVWTTDAMEDVIPFGRQDTSREHGMEEDDDTHGVLYITKPSNWNTEMLNK